MVQEASSDILSQVHHYRSLGINTRIFENENAVHEQKNVSQAQLDTLKQRLWSAIITELDHFEQRRANHGNFENTAIPDFKSGNVLQTRLEIARANLDIARESESAAHTLLMLTNALTQLHVHKASETHSATPCDDDIPRDLNAFKQELAQCLNHLRQKRAASEVVEKAQSR